jgi:hypothetical protein
MSSRRDVRVHRRRCFSSKTAQAACVLTDKGGSIETPYNVARVVKKLSFSCLRETVAPLTHWVVSPSRKLVGIGYGRVSILTILSCSGKTRRFRYVRDGLTNVFSLLLRGEFNDYRLCCSLDLKPIL